MNKKALVIALALVVALAGSALASVSFSGKFTATMSTDSFTFEDGYKLTPGFSFAISASNKDVTTVIGDEEEDDEEITNWDFSAGIALKEGKFELGKYKLGLYDDYFKAWVWGNGQNLSDKATPFGFITAGKAAADIRARLEVPVVDLATITLDFDPKDNLKAFVDGEVEGFDVGLAYAGTGLTDEAGHALAVFGKGAVQSLNVKAEAGVKLGDELGLAFGFGADTLVTDELKVEGSVKYLNDKWADEQTTTLTGKATYTEAEFQAVVDASVTLKEENENKVTLSGKYRLSDAVAYSYLFNRSRPSPTYFDLDAPAFGVSAVFANLEFNNVRVDVASPVVEDLIWVHAYASYLGEKKFNANVLGHILATDKLTVNPSVDYKTEGQIIDAKLNATYKLGLSDTTLSFLIQKVFTEEGLEDDDGDPVAKELISVSVSVPF